MQVGPPGAPHARSLFDPGSVTFNRIQVPAVDPVQFNASLTLDHAMLLPWKVIDPTQVELVVTVQLLLANIAVATFCEICAYIRDSKLFKNLAKLVFLASLAALSSAD